MAKTGYGVLNEIYMKSALVNKQTSSRKSNKNAPLQAINIPIRDSDNMW